ncbi:MAG TPA: DinB family protein [Gemmataceae bacterium]|nr:DinB family protein [Gemmataceae bacterium]
MYPPLESRADILKWLDEMTAARKIVLLRCEALRPALRNDPVYPGTWSLLENLQHLAWAEAWMLAWIQKRPEVLPREERPPLPPLELAAIRTALDEAHAAVIAFVKGASEAVLKEKCQYSRQGEQTVGGVLSHLIEHEIHHRGFILHKLGVLAGKTT